MKDDFFKSGLDYWAVAETIKDIYMSDGSINALMDFEAVLEEVNLYAFKNWILGELVEGPIISNYTVSCTFLWPDHLMPDPRGAKRLLPFDCVVKWKKTKMKVPRKIESPNDYRQPGFPKAKLTEMPIWLVEITMPKNLISDIRSGSIELEGEQIDLGELDASYEEDLDKAANIDDELDQATEEEPTQDQGNA